MARIVCTGLTKRYDGGAPVLHPLDLEIGDGEFIVLLGPSGCGKSTMLRMIAGLETITGGTLAIGGAVVNDLAARERNVAMVFQNYALYPHMSVYENIAFGLRRLKVPAAEIDRRVREVARVLGLDALLDRKPRAMSGGQQQRAAIARAMIKTPDVFLFDEPLSNLDAKLRAQLRGDIKRLHQRLKTTTLYVTHDQLEAMTLADRVVLMRGGRIEQLGTPAELYGCPHTVFAAGFVGTPAMNFADGVIERTAGRVALAAGGARWTLAARRFAGLPDGLRVKLAIRPNYLRIAPGAHAPAATLALEGRVELVELLGAEALVTFGRNGAPFAALVPASAAPALGAVVTFTFDERDLHLFDAATGRNVMLPEAGAPADAERPGAAMRPSPGAPHRFTMSRP
ncbi:sn-glycerol-3-phosphate ABC transporter ATP-binding protein UgpC [Burkholderia pseudomallei]|uniref:ABC transporter ATP-binding protein n=1 Tax=Burkholderia pseudomallei TaxID=28450 RepID=UPI000055B318|nr:sn-glycerol-3-phosphate ABC transporter ATP-binding protein UgpC [Burkholderia pseudomallei]ABN88556.1 ABC-type sugar transport systems, ATPase component [Burkholderia pseudomallei 668]AJX90376.1 ABC transporter family protein [Burkholderia pseudomallei]MBF3413352.1 sn-glycerol-3-phosphate ABC transporter ATP-binding protein UgpC [Burkholderia pseudomallei]MBF3442434.1 sn-glycerol-3-phosphate ABC transporter ATP-binding protein UgpC [Burkholderia pseudomallei]MBF3448681.1 sn-glycerol-3-phos